MTNPTAVHTIGKRYTFDAAHHLPDLPEGHKCGRLHGHTYTVEVHLTSTGLTPPGFVIDYADLAPLKNYIDTSLDHQNLNDILHTPPTSENLAEWLHTWCAHNLPIPDGVHITAIRVSETPTSWAEYRPPTPT